MLFLFEEVSVMITTRKLTISAMVVALYIVVLYVTQSVSFGAYQIRIATSLYALDYAVVPANLEAEVGGSPAVKDHRIGS